MTATDNVKAADRDDGSRLAAVKEKHDAASLSRVNRSVRHGDA